VDAVTLDADEPGLVDRVAERRDELAELACALFAFDATSRSGPDDPPRDEVALQTLLAERLRAKAAEIDLWEPAPALGARPRLRGARWPRPRVGGSAARADR
jgi:hypothetical protein